MTLEELKALTQEIIDNAGNQGELSIRVQKLHDEYSNMITATATQTADIEKLKAEKESLGKANTALWLKIGYKAEPEQKEALNAEEPKSFDDLFDNGQLK